ncbi:hypothetical protein C8Q77DRAFT_123310 [Trametes polyzona]|nr:hypothetical protein C8Q77DRAFT_123310 [Trametes polyzona]
MQTRCSSRLRTSYASDSDADHQLHASAEQCFDASAQKLEESSSPATYTHSSRQECTLATTRPTALCLLSINTGDIHPAAAGVRHFLFVYATIRLCCSSVTLLAPLHAFTMTSKKTPKCKRESSPRPRPKTAKQEVVKALKKVPIQSLAVSSLPPWANDMYYSVFATEVAQPALPPPPPSPATQRRSSHKPRRRTDKVEQLASAPPSRSKARKPSISPIHPPSTSRTARSNSLRHPTMHPDDPRPRSSHKGGRDRTRPRDSYEHTSPTYATNDRSQLISEHREANGTCKMSVHAGVATAPYEPDRSPSSLLPGFPYPCMIPLPPPATPPHGVGACKNALSDLNGGYTPFTNSGVSSGEQPGYQSPVAAVLGGHRRNDAVMGLETGPSQSGRAVPGTTPLHDHTQYRDNEAAHAAQLQHVSDRVWSYGGSACDQIDYTCLDRTGPECQSVENFDFAQDSYCPNEDGHQLVGPSSQNAPEDLGYIPTFGVAPSAIDGGAPTHAVYEVDQSAFGAGGYPQEPAIVAMGFEGALPSAQNSGDTSGAFWYLNSENVPDLSSSPGTHSSTSGENFATYLEMELGAFATAGYNSSVATVPTDEVRAHPNPLDGETVNVAWSGYCDVDGRPFYGMETTIDEFLWATRGMQQ